jgi:hypothetical protein
VSNKHLLSVLCSLERREKYLISSDGLLVDRLMIQSSIELLLRVSGKQIDSEKNQHQVPRPESTTVILLSTTVPELYHT